MALMPLKYKEMVTLTPQNRPNPRRPAPRVCLFIGLVAIGIVTAASVSPPPVPPTPKRPTTTVYHGVVVKDDYQWLENWDDAAVVVWSAAQNSRARAILDALPSRKQIRAQLKTLFENTSATYYSLVYRPGVLFALEELPPSQQAFLITLASPDDPRSARIVVDPNRIDPKGLTRIDFYEPSRDGRLVAVSYRRAGVRTAHCTCTTFLQARSYRT